MDTVIHDRLKLVTGNLFSIIRDTENGTWFIEVGIPNTWEIGDNDDIDCETIGETESAKLIKISPKHEDVIVDDLILFVEVIIGINKEIAEKEKEFSQEMERKKKEMDEKIKSFYIKLEEHKQNSFKSLKKQIQLEIDEKKSEMKNEMEVGVENAVKKTTKQKKTEEELPAEEENTDE